MGKFLLKYKITASALLLGIFVFSSCSDWLSIAPENDLIKEKFWKKKQDVDAALAGTYDGFRDAAMSSFIWGELRGDMITLGTDFSGYVSIATSDISPSNGVISWAGYYKAINLANTLMYYDNDVLALDRTFTPRIKDAVDAEALFIRSLSYFYLVRLWKDVPLILTPSISDTSDLFRPKNTEQEVLNQIIKDLVRAKDMAYTTEFQNNPGYYKGRANKYSIMALLADVYLWDQQYQKCIDYCDSISNTGLFGLESYSTWFDLYSPGNSQIESLFEIQYDDNYESQNNPLYDDLINQIKMTKTSTTLLTKDDLRNCELKGPLWKYAGFDITVGRNGSQRDANFIYYRYADVLLMRAEANTELNRLSDANADLRLVVERAGLTHIDIIVQEDMRKAILDERGREFMVEGKRWFDLLRAAKRNHFENKQIIIDLILAGADIKQQAILKTRVFDTLSYYLPIPEHELLYNQNLKQNPYYDR
jgi:starch-binding outer membrane protein, SusD/RagB family